MMVSIQEGEGGGDGCMGGGGGGGSGCGGGYANGVTIHEEEVLGETDASDYYHRKNVGRASRTNGLKLRPDEAKRKVFIVAKKDAQRQKQMQKSGGGGGGGSNKSGRKKRNVTG